MTSLTSQNSKFKMEVQKVFNQCTEKTDHKRDFTNLVNLTISVLRFIIGVLYEYSFLILVAVILVIVLFFVYKVYWSPVVYVKDLSQIGFDHIKAGPDRVLNIARAQSARKLGAKLPPPYPNGWFALVESRQLKVGGVVAVDALGQNLCVYRGEDGLARCVDAYCPHLGANFAVGGSVCGNCIECPFHQWRFGANGALVSVPGVEVAPKGVSIKSWPTAEADGAVWFWHDAEDRTPQWKLNDPPQLTNWKLRAANEFTVNCHIQEIPENGADVAHLNAVHSPSLLSRLGEKYPVLHNLIGAHHWNAEWKRGEDHLAHINLTHDYKMFKIDLFHLEVDITQIGPGHVRLLISSPLGPILVSQSVTPISPLEQRVVHRVFSPSYNALCAVVLNYAEAKMIERDIAIWNNKKYVAAPAYVRADRTIRAFRNWYSQFYSENSVSFKDVLQKTLDW